MTLINTEGNRLRFELNSGSGAMSESYTAPQLTLFKSALLSLASVPTTSEEFVLTLDSNSGSPYDMDFYRHNLAGGSVRLSLCNEEGVFFQPGDALKAVFPNGGSVAWAFQAILEEFVK